MHFQFRESQIFDDNDEAVVSGQEYGECYSEEEEWDEDDEDESQDVTESFSEASYQVEQCENVSGVVQSEHRYEVSHLVKASIEKKCRCHSFNNLEVETTNPIPARIRRRVPFI